MKTHHGRMTLQDCRDKAVAHLREIESDIAADRAQDAAHYDTFDADDIREAEIRGATWALETMLDVLPLTTPAEMQDRCVRLVDAKRGEAT